MRAGSGRLLSGVAVAVFGVATVGLFIVSRGKWSDAIIDSGREWIVPDALARGDLLYRDVVYWFGPFTPYFHAAFFRVFGSSFATLVLAGIVGSLGVLAALFCALRTLTGRSEAALWTALAVPALVFMPNAGGSILGMGYRIWHAAAFGLLSLAVVGGDRLRRSSRSIVGGALAGLAGLCRTEWGLLVLTAVALVEFLRAKERREVWQREIPLFGGFLLVFGGGFTLFGTAAGWKSLLNDAPVLLVNLPNETRSHVVFSGFSAWRTGIWPLLYSTASWAGVFLLTAIVALRREDPGRVRILLSWLAALLAVFALSVWGSGGVPEAPVWSAAPFVCASACGAGLLARSSSRASALTGFGVLGLIASHRRPFFVGDAPYVAPPLLFALVCAAGLWVFVVARQPIERGRERLDTALRTVLFLLIGLAFTARFVEYADDDRVPIASTAGFLSARAERTREIEELATAIRAVTRDGDGLVIFPEGEVLNFLSGRRNPLRHKLYLPGYLTSENEAEVLRELNRTLPAIVVVWRRSLGEYGSGGFGESYGARIARWIDQNYVPFIPPTQDEFGRSSTRVFDAFRRK